MPNKTVGAAAIQQQHGEEAAGQRRRPRLVGIGPPVWPPTVSTPGARAAKRLLAAGIVRVRLLPRRRSHAGSRPKPGRRSHAASRHIGQELKRPGVTKAGIEPFAARLERRREVQQLGLAGRNRVPFIFRDHRRRQHVLRIGQLVEHGLKLPFLEAAQPAMRLDAADQGADDRLGLTAERVAGGLAFGVVLLPLPGGQYAPGQQQRRDGRPTVPIYRGLLLHRSEIK